MTPLPELGTDGKVIQVCDASACELLYLRCALLLALSIVIPSSISCCDPGQPSGQLEREQEFGVDFMFGCHTKEDGTYGQRRGRTYCVVVCCFLNGVMGV